MKNKIWIISLAVFFALFSLRLVAQSKLYPNEFDLGDVVLLDGPFKNGRDLNVQVLLKYDVDRLLAPYRKEAGLSVKAVAYPNWDGLDGHVGGHYLSALAMNYAATGNPECKKRMDYMVSEMKACQEANTVHHPEWGVGYAGGFPNSQVIWSALKKGHFGPYRIAWAPWYNLHKAYAGLRDAWLYGNNAEAKTVFLKFCDWGMDLTAGLTEEQMQALLDVEHGGMNETFADAFQMTGEEKYLAAAKRFSHRALLDPLSNGVDNLDNKHANTQIPKFIGFERISELAHEQKYHTASQFFWQNVVDHRTLAFGGNSRREHFPSKAASIDYVLEDDGPETCNSYNMLKLTEGLFRNQPDARYADYYEGTLYNHILSSQHPQHGGYVYFTSARPRHYRVYSVPNEAMWCCVGTGMENHGKYNQFIYTHVKDSLFVNLFIASELQWKEKGIKIRQETNFPFDEKTKLTVTEGTSRFMLMIRYPGWVGKSALTVTVNQKPVSYQAQPSSYIRIDRKWKKGDVVEVRLPMQNTLEHLPHVSEYVAFKHGPILLGAATGTEDLKGLVADDGRWGQHAGGDKLPVDKAPILIEDDLMKMTAKLEAAGDQPLNFKLPGRVVNGTGLHLKPFFQIHDARYMIYWLALTSKGYKAYTDSMRHVETERLKLENRTIDYVSPGEQQPETDHAMQQDKSGTGNTQQEFWRDARSGGYFSYELKTEGATRISLFVRYWGAEWGNRKFDIYIDDEKLLTEDNTGKWNVAMFKDVIHEIPDAMVAGKQKIRVKFQPLPGSTAGAVFKVRLLRP